LKLIAFNGSPRKGWNTATMLKHAVEGAAAAGAETETVHLYDLQYKGCRSCFACKTKGGKSYGKCSMKDDLAPVLQRVEEADAIILGSPIYWGRVTGEMASFMDRLLFPYLVYANYGETLYPKKIRTGLIYTMNVTEEQRLSSGYDVHLNTNERVMGKTFGSAETLCSHYTLQSDDSGRFLVSGETEMRMQRRKDQFPEDCKKAFDLGVRLVSKG
jgi:multimeric flavodoxin WrbA